MKFWRMSLALVAVAIVAGCASAGPTRTGASLDDVRNSVGAPKAGHARIVVLRDKAFPGLIDYGWKVHLDGAPMGDLKTGTFVYGDRPAGRHQLLFARPGDLSRASRHDFSAAPGRTYFFRLAMNDKGRMVDAGGIAVGLTGWFVSSAIADASDERGLFDFIALDEASARLAMTDLRLAE
jgi:Protein of unknown function (DUF2846)